jgi:hypothetical protein
MKRSNMSPVPSKPGSRIDTGYVTLSQSAQRTAVKQRPHQETEDCQVR